MDYIRVYLYLYSGTEIYKVNATVVKRSRVRLFQIGSSIFYVFQNSFMYFFKFFFFLGGGGVATFLFAVMNFLKPFLLFV